MNSIELDFKEKYEAIVKVANAYKEELFDASVEIATCHNALKKNIKESKESKLICDDLKDNITSLENAIVEKDVEYKSACVTYEATVNDLNTLVNENKVLKKENKNLTSKNIRLQGAPISGGESSPYSLYRILEQGDIIEEDDEILIDGHEWNKTKLMGESISNITLLHRRLIVGGSSDR
jgi:hypothetical protein